MARKYVDCRKMPSESGCTVSIAADTDDEVVEAAVQHAVAVHGRDDTPEFRDMLRGAIHEDSRPV